MKKNWDKTPSRFLFPIISIFSHLMIVIITVSFIVYIVVIPDSAAFFTYSTISPPCTVNIVMPSETLLTAPLEEFEEMPILTNTEEDGAGLNQTGVSTDETSEITDADAMKEEIIKEPTGDSAADKTTEVAVPGIQDIPLEISETPSVTQDTSDEISKSSSEVQDTVDEIPESSSATQDTSDEIPETPSEIKKLPTLTQESSPAQEVTPDPNEESEEHENLEDYHEGIVDRE